jgi:hypothetical protein
VIRQPKPQKHLIAAVRRSQVLIFVDAEIAPVAKSEAICYDFIRNYAGEMV